MRGRARVLAVLAVVAASAMWLADSASASESPPEFGRCISVGAGNGGFSAKRGCAFTGLPDDAEWLAIEPTSPQRGLTMRSGTLKIQTPTGPPQMTCSSSTATGELTGGGSEAITSMTLDGCQQERKPCRSNPGLPGEIHTLPLTATLGAIPGEHRLWGAPLGLLAAPSSGDTIATFSCSATATIFVLRGSFAGLIKKTDKMGPTIAWQAKQTKGVPALTELVGLPEAALTLENEGLAPSEDHTEPAALSAKFSEAFEAEAEASTVR